jgi:hypothetical protein
VGETAVSGDFASATGAVGSVASDGAGTLGAKIGLASAGDVTGARAGGAIGGSTVGRSGPSFGL